MTRDELIINNIPLVYYIIKKLNLYYMCDEYYDIGVIGLIKAADTFNPDMNCKFNSYAGMRIKYEILTEVRKSHTEKRRADRDIVSIYEDLYNDGGEVISILDSIMADCNVEEEAIKRVEIDLIYEASSKLPAKEKEVFDYMYRKNMLQNEIAAIWGVHYTTVSKVHKSMIYHLKKLVVNGEKFISEYECKYFDF